MTISPFMRGDFSPTDTTGGATNMRKDLKRDIRTKRGLFRLRHMFSFSAVALACRMWARGLGQAARRCAIPQVWCSSAGQHNNSSNLPNPQCEYGIQIPAGP